MENGEKLPNQERPLLEIATAVARLHGWSGGIVMEPWYQWLTPGEILVRGGDSTTYAVSERYEPRKNAGEEGTLYRLPVRANPDGTDPPVRQKSIPLNELSRRAKTYGGVMVGGTSISPDGRWLLIYGRREEKSGNASDQPYWVALPIDGSREVIWPVSHFPKKGTSRRKLSELLLSRAVWLPDSGGILEIEADSRQPGKVHITGRIRLLDSPTIPRPLPPRTIDMRLAGRKYDWGQQWIRAIQKTGSPQKGTVGLRRLNIKEENGMDPVRWGSLKNLPPDRAILYRWDWREGVAATPTIATENFILPVGYHLFDERISPKGDRIIWALMNREHHVVVHTGNQLPPQFKTGKISLWASRTGTASRPVEIGSIPIPRGKEADCYQTFGLGYWLPGNNRISFLFDGVLYTVAVP